MTNDAELLRDGENAFPEIVSRIRSAERSVEINMFIWRDDEIGRTLAAELLRAADRGVRVSIVKDRYGVSCEYGEEAQRSLFHPRISPGERAAVWALEFLYNRDLLGREHAGRPSPLLDELKRHPNVTLQAEEKRYDHSKYFIFDDKIVILGGVNIEDKENGADRAGRRYRDYMVKLCGGRYVSALRARLRGELSDGSGMFAVNIKRPKRVFEIEDRYLKLIGAAEEELTILMAYMAPVRSVMRALEDAARRGVRIRLLLPARANFIDDLNHAAAARLLRLADKYGANIKIFLSPDMTHTKLLMSEKRISVGSCNIMRNAFHTLNELNYEAPNDDSPFAAAVRESVKELIADAAEVRGAGEIRYRRGMALLERSLM